MARSRTLRLFVREDVTRVLVDRLASNRLDLLLVALPCECGEADTLSDVARRVPGRATEGPQAGHARARVPVSALARERLLLLLEDGHCLRDQALAVCGMAGEQEGFAATSLHTLAQMVAGGLGVTLLPQHGRGRGRGRVGGRRVAPAIAGGSAWRTIGLAWRPRSPRADEYRALAPLIKPS